MHRKTSLFNMALMNDNKLLNCFCKTLCCVVFIFGAYWLGSYCSFHRSQRKIENAYLQHIASVDSLFCDIEKELLRNNNEIQSEISNLMDSLSLIKSKGLTQYDKAIIQVISGSVKFSQKLDYAAIFHKDSLLRKQEANLAQEQMRNLLSLHIDKVDNDYAMLGLWGAVLSILFIAFGFFAIFKIEETKKEAEKIVEMVSNKADEIIKGIEGKAGALLNSLDNINTEYETFYAMHTQNFNNAMEDFRLQFNTFLAGLSRTRRSKDDKKAKSSTK